MAEWVFSISHFSDFHSNFEFSGLVVNRLDGNEPALNTKHTQKFFRITITVMVSVATLGIPLYSMMEQCGQAVSHEAP